MTFKRNSTKTDIMASLGIIGMGMLITAQLVGCATPPSFQSETTVLGLELETCGNITSGESPVPKLRFGLVRHKGQIIQQSQIGYLYSDASNIDLWSASGNTTTDMTISPVSK